MDNFWNKVRYGLLLLLITLIAFSSHPTITVLSRNAGLENGTILSSYIILVFAVLFVLCIPSIFKLRIQQKCWLLLFIIFLSYLCTYFLFDTSKMMGDIRSIGICLCAIVIGCHIELDEKRVTTILLAFSGLITFIGLLQVIYNIGGFQIVDRYADFNKNILGVELSTAVLICVSFYINKRGKPFFRIIILLNVVLAFAVLLTIRARTATICALLIILYYVFSFYKNNYKKNIAYIVFISIIALTIVLVLLPQGVSDYVYNSFFQNHEDDFTSGRLDRNIAAIHFLKGNWFIGNLGRASHIKWIHNFPLLKLCDYGLFFSFPILLLYLLLFIYPIKKSLNHKVTIWSIGYFALIIPFIISMAEPTLPFGPGTGTVFSFVLFGISLKKSSD